MPDPIISDAGAGILGASLSGTAVLIKAIGEYARRRWPTDGNTRGQFAVMHGKLDRLKRKIDEVLKLQRDAVPDRAVDGERMRELQESVKDIVQSVRGLSERLRDLEQAFHGLQGRRDT